MKIKYTILRSKSSSGKNDTLPIIPMISEVTGICEISVMREYAMRSNKIVISFEI